MKTIVYIDGFNLYYGAVRGTQYKWLNIRRMCEALLPKHQIERIKYFTARVSARPDDPDQPTRQNTFLRALRTLPDLDIIFGHFLQSEVRMPLAHPEPGRRFALVVKTEEKGSDVNIATHMVHDGHLGLYDAAVIVTNDSDLCEPVRVVRHSLAKVVGILNPHQHASRALAAQASFTKPIRQGVLASSQFPNELTDEHGTFRKPGSW